MNITAVLVLLFATLICLGPATAQTARPKGKPIMYKCVDTRGKTYYSDKMSTDCAKGIELSQTGRVIERPPVKAAPVNSKAAELDPTVSADKERRDRALMATYTNIEEIDSARERTLALPMQGIKTNEARLARANSNLSELKKEAEALVAKNKPVPEQLTDDIAVREVAEVPAGFHAIRDAIQKTYRYSIAAGPDRPVFERSVRWHVPVRLDVDGMMSAATALAGKHDFAAFQAAGSDRQTTIRQITRLAVTAHEGGAEQGIELEVSANGFLYNMVRIIAGSLVLVGRGNHPPDWLRSGLESRDRSRTGPTAPAHGLSLLAVCYEGRCRCPGKQAPDERCRGLPDARTVSVSLPGVDDDMAAED